MFEDAVIQISALLNIEYKKCKDIRDNRNDFFAHPNQQNEHREVSCMQYLPWKKNGKQVMNFGKIGDQSKILNHDNIEKDIKFFIDEQINQLQLCYNKLDTYVRKYYPKKVMQNWTFYDILGHSHNNDKTFYQILKNEKI